MKTALAMVLGAVALTAGPKWLPSPPEAVAQTGCCRCGAGCGTGCGCGCGVDSDAFLATPAAANSVGTLFPAVNVHQLSHLPLADIGGTAAVAGTGNARGNDIWGWTDPGTGREFALFGRTDGTAFIDVTDPVNPVYQGILPSATGNKVWRDVKVYNNHAFIVSDSNGSHGLQVFDLTQLVSHTGPPVTFSETAHLSTFTRAHNIAINEDTGYAYVVGSNQASGGLHVIDVSTPTSPVHVGNYSGDGYTHDVQVVTYAGPDAEHVGKEIAFSANEDTLTIVDVTNKASMTQLSRTGYPDRGYTHQGWLSDDHAFFFMNDELDERNGLTGGTTRTHVWQLDDIDAPQYVGYYQHATGAIDHNLYYKNGLIYEANYTTGLRVLEFDGDSLQVDGNNVITAGVSEVASLDTHLGGDGASFNGAWSVYPFFDSGKVIVSDIEDGLIVAQLNILSGDTNSDRAVDMTDLQTLANYFLTAVDAGFLEADFDHSGFVDYGDLALMAPNWLVGVPPEPGQLTFDEAIAAVGLPAVPEPGTLLLLAAPACAVLARRRRRC